MPSYVERYVVTASRLQERLINAPAAVSVVASGAIESSAAQNYGDLLQTLPGISVVQLSARDINIASRAQNGALVTSQLALVDGRTVYQDFFGFVSWDLLPIQKSEIDQIEVIRGPVSAVWGANAMTGIVNVITKSPRQMEGTTVAIGFGAIDRSVEGSDLENGLLFSLNATHAHVVNDRLAFKVSAGAFTQSAFARPTGVIANEFETPYPAYSNTGSTQPKLDVRIDVDMPGETPDHTLIFAGGIAGNEGIIHTGTGPFDIQRGTFLGYGKLNYQRGNFKLNVFTNILDGEAPALLVADANGEPILFRFANRTFDVEVSDSRLLGVKHLLNYGGNFRHNSFDLSLAPRGDNRDEFGVYIQDEIFFSERLSWLIGGRVDKFDVLRRLVFSPRTALLLKPTPNHTLRLSFNRAFRAPSFFNNFLETEFLSGIDLGALDPRLEGELFNFPVAALGSDTLNEESLTAYEIGYTGILGARTIVSASYYVNNTRDLILFTQSGSYDSSHPPPGWPLDPAILDVLVQRGIGLPSELAFKNFERVRDEGVELSVRTQVNGFVNAFASYTWRREPKPFGFELTELNLPPSYHFNAGFDFTYDRYFGDVTASFVDGGFWQDVLDVRFHGPTEPYAIVNAGFGVHWEEGKLTTAVKVTNLTNAEVQHHVFGDIIKRQIVGELRFHF